MPLFTISYACRRSLKRCLLFILAGSFLAMSFAQPIAIAQKGEVKTEMAAADFPKVVTEYITDMHSRHPTAAASSGIHSWDAQLEDYSQHTLGEEIATIKKFQIRLDHIPPLALEFSDVMDYQILAANMKSRLLELEQIKSYERNPQIYSDTISNGLVAVTMFDYAPAETRLQYVVSKEKQVPRLLEEAKSNVKNPPAIFLKIALESFKGTLGFIKGDLPKAFPNLRDSKLQKEFVRSTKLAGDAIASYIKDLEKMKPGEGVTFAIGRQNYEAKLKYDEGIEMSTEVLLKIAYRELNRAQDDFRRTAFKIDPHRDMMKVWADIQADHPKPGTLIQEAQKQLNALTQFIEKKKIVTLLPGPAPVVAATPDFMRWSTASMQTPGPFERPSVQARYQITDVDPKWTDKQKEEYLASINYQQLWTTSIHEVYPGHFVQAQYMTKAPSVVRKTWAFASGSFVEGWAHYTEQMMVDEGFGGGDPKLRMGQIADALLRLCRFVVGISEHTRNMTVDQGTRFFMNNAYMGETPSRIEAERGTFDPTYLVYTVGKLAILKLREDYKRERGAEFSLEEFHDRLLSNGLAPLKQMRLMLMPSDRGKLLE